MKEKQGYEGKKSNGFENYIKSKNFENDYLYKKLTGHEQIRSQLENNVTNEISRNIKIPLIL